MSKTTPKKLTEAQWDDAVEAYELGTKHAVQIAQDLGVSPSTVSREFKRRGCVKACRVSEYVAQLEAALDIEYRREAPQRRAEEVEAARRLAELDRVIGGMVKTIIAAGKAGNLAAAGPAIEQARKSLAA